MAMKKVAWLKIYIEGGDDMGERVAIEARSANNKQIRTCFYYPGQRFFERGLRERERMENDLWDFISGKEGQLTR